MTCKATLRIEDPMEAMCVHVCTDEKLIAIVSLEDFDRACETLDRVRHDRVIKQDEEQIALP
jgi:hypothetical protein